ncbi:hypothetical protein TIFTF001_001090 [Ficus carica]|uniref:Uncharacterized protein n=1 Tax=Ficus carica TaxID=3494 RepID=A0AA87Z020_FICCA|nr:hypothetical protein TIFTF001_001090 [Ficus carica]
MPSNFLFPFVFPKVICLLSLSLAQSLCRFRRRHPSLAKEADLKLATASDDDNGRSRDDSPSSSCPSPTTMAMVLDFLLQRASPDLGESRVADGSELLEISDLEELLGLVDHFRSFSTFSSLHKSNSERSLQP